MNPAVYSGAMTGVRTATNHHHHTHETKECTFVCDSCHQEFHKIISVEKDCPTVCTTCSGENTIVAITFIIVLLCCVVAMIIHSAASIKFVKWMRKFKNKYKI